MYRRYWFFSNLQLAIDRALLGALQGDGSMPAGEQQCGGVSMSEALWFWCPLLGIGQQA
jgi:hypothetical protein